MQPVTNEVHVLGLSPLTCSDDYITCVRSQ